MASRLSVEQALGVGIGVGIAAGFLAALALLLLAVFAATKTKRAWDLLSKLVYAIYIRNMVAVEKSCQQKAFKVELPLWDKYPWRISSNYYVGLPVITTQISFKDMSIICHGLHTDIYALVDKAFCGSSFFDKRGPVEMKRISPSAFDEHDLVALAGEPANGGTWSETLADCETRCSAARCFVAQVLFRVVAPECPFEESLLPLEVARCYRFLSEQLEEETYEKEERYRAVWRAVTFACIRLRYEGFGIGPELAWRDWLSDDDPRKDRIASLTRRIAEILKFDELAIPERDDEESGVERVIRETPEARLFKIVTEFANFGYALFSRDQEWQVSLEKNERNSWLVFPELQMVRDKIPFTASPALYAYRYYPGPAQISD